MVKEVVYENKNPVNMPVRFLDDNYISIKQTVAGKLGLEIPNQIIENANFTY